MDTIRNYLETLFLELPKTPEVEKAKQELLSNMEDHYLALREEGKSEHEAIGAIISEFGSVDELKEALQFAHGEEAEEPLEEFPITVDEMLAFMVQRKRSASGLSLGISLCVLAVAGFIASETGRFGLGLGFLSFFVFVALGVGLIIFYGMQLGNEGKPLNDRFVSKAVQRAAKESKEDYQRSFQISIVLGVCFCVLSLIPFFLIEMYGIWNPGFGIPFMFLFVAAGVFLLVYGGVYYSSFDKFINQRYFVADDDELGPNARREKYGDVGSIGFVLEKVFWPLVVCVYLFWSFTTGSWGYSWIVFVIAGVAHSVLEGVFKKV
ncbi:hypothetical protein NRIC_35030 [Enterococcus florum]|uniref:Beta-carotene 15,15'-monooxygenase n=1 Tax=Enterococcus florum TaxID=2480627 RepID=A0A4P5PJ48_9ENTE|nr:permease prefix domain 1-containing protein [Enterococcus florum]GCF95612.1 hypothetical protein NRIC_35030 [Enterococcus florum]